MLKNIDHNNSSNLSCSITLCSISVIRPSYILDTSLIIPLSCKSYADEEIAEVLDSLRSGAVTMGKKCIAFEEAFAEYMQSRHAIFLNSGSSANLLAWFALTNPMWKDPLEPGFEVIVPAISWSTTIWPIIQAGGTPVLVDCDPETLGIKTAGW